jgi:MYXO-CTERM domain-containing protein
MRTSNRFISKFEMLAGISRLALGMALGLVPSCVLDEGGMTDDPVASEDPTAENGDTSADSVCTSGTYRCHAHVRTTKAGQRITSHAATPAGYGPTGLQSAYKIDPAVIVPTTTPTVAIVDAYGYAAIESDLAAYRTQFGLPPCTKANGCLKVVNQLGQTSPLPANPPANDDWTVETALDMDMVSAACPKCNILVVQAKDNTGDGLFVAQNAAAQLGAAVISNSWGGPEPAPTTANPNPLAAEETYFNHPGIAIFVSAGDDGYNDAGAGPDYPATSAHAIAVGGTRLVRAANTRGWSETAWTKGGSACSLSIPKPAYQTVSPCTKKATADIAADGDPATGLAVYNAGAGGWITVGGTSASAPFVAAIFAATGNGAQSSGAFISSKASTLYDVTTGTNGTCPQGALLCNAATGWDGPTGYGTPNASALVPSTGTGTGTGTGSGTGTGTGSGTGTGTTTGSTGSNGGTGTDGGAQGITGGCSTGGGAGAGVMLGVAMLGLRRRRR